MGNDDWPSDPSDESQPKCEKAPPKSSKNEGEPIGTLPITNELHCQEVKKRLNRIVLGLKLVEHKSEKPKFLSNPNSYLAIHRGGGSYRRPRLKQQKTLTETAFHFFAF